MGDILAFHRRDGLFEFTCAGCGIDVISTVRPSMGLCFCCDFFRRHPQIPPDTREILRGERPNG